MSHHDRYEYRNPETEEASRPAPRVSPERIAAMIELAEKVGPLQVVKRGDAARTFFVTQAQDGFLLHDRLLLECRDAGSGRDLTQAEHELFVCALVDSSRNMRDLCLYVRDLEAALAARERQFLSAVLQDRAAENRESPFDEARLAEWRKAQETRERLEAAAIAWAAGDSCRCSHVVGDHDSDCPWAKLEQALFDAVRDRVDALPGGRNDL